MKHKNQARVEEKRKENIFSDSKWCLRFGYGAENKICSIKETQAFLFYLVQKKRTKESRLSKGGDRKVGFFNKKKKAVETCNAS